MHPRSGGAGSSHDRTAIPRPQWALTLRRARLDAGWDATRLAVDGGIAASGRELYILQRGQLPRNR